MNITIHPHRLQGEVSAIPSKSHAHRLLICAAFADKNTVLTCPETNRDILATISCLRSLGADITQTGKKITVIPVKSIPESAVLDCGESGSTLRFLLPIVGALGVHGKFLLSGRLPQRPLSPLWEELERMGCQLSRPENAVVECAGALQAGNYIIPGDVSSQYISGLLLAMPLLSGESRLTVTGKTESAPYVVMTQNAMRQFGVESDGYRIAPGSRYHSPGAVTVEGDWSNAAFFLTARALGNELHISGLQDDSSQGDKMIIKFLSEMDRNPVINLADTPDLAPILAVAAAAGNGARFTNIARLRLKESDRVDSIAEMIRSLGGTVSVTETEMEIKPCTLRGGTVDARSDHRIAMSAAIAATVACGDVTIIGADCVSKSYPSFWNLYRMLGGQYEQCIQ